MILATVALLASAAAPAPCYVHSPTGIVFAASPGGLTCSEPRVDDPAREEVSVRYEGDRLHKPIFVTVFVYRKQLPTSRPDEPLLDHLERVRREVARAYSGTTCKSWTPEGRPRMRGFRCTGRDEEIGPIELANFIGLEDMGSWWLKVLATTPADYRDGERDLSMFLQGFVLQRPVKR